MGALEAVVGSEAGIELIARDLVDIRSASRRHGQQGHGGCMSRRICVELFRQIAARVPIGSATMTRRAR